MKALLFAAIVKNPRDTFMYVITLAADTPLQKKSFTRCIVHSQFRGFNASVIQTLLLTN